MLAPSSLDQGREGIKHVVESSKLCDFGRIAARISKETAEELYIGMPVLIKILQHGDGMAIYYAEPARTEDAGL